MVNTNTVTFNNDTRWRKPVAGGLKYNVDATVFKEDNKYGIGLCIRDEKECIEEEKLSISMGLQILKRPK